MRIAFLIAAPIALAACGSADESAPVDNSVEEGTPGRSADGVETSLADPAPASVTAPDEAADGLRAIPAAFRGVWDFAEGDCLPFSDLRLEIGERSIEFYESLGTVRSIERSGDDAIMLDLAMEGEGERWTQETELQLTSGGERLLVLDPESPETGAEYPRKRCEG